MKIISALELLAESVYRGDCVGWLICYLMKLYQLHHMRLQNLQCNELVQYYMKWAVHVSAVLPHLISYF